LDFVVSSLKRGYNDFDLDNLAKPVLDAIGAQAESVWVLVEVGNEPGLWVRDVAPPEPAPSTVTFYLARPPTASLRGVAALPELEQATPMGLPDQAVGASLRFDSAEAQIANFDFSGPVKKVIDSLWPVLGGTAKSPADHRIRDLRITRGAAPGKIGVTISAWLLGDAST
jgi:hypothetical protein